ncbi:MULTISPECIES: DUF2975 domain-containing protein [unclassified Bacillus (in: firmicutes)]|uniref:DUF2975 domain-containing protein n=1 Tax=unclassified Bacillus (in: firmicutes) TaxID=185979 RepID=UPI001BE61968|nr:MULTISPECIES: DUF2975 domain-containing protein [unclassified Bacillus (in: firmicutes)]MBT2615932.1 DUF2975 domain-containing protein [Bacillus sp. ISL-78]MBT2630316.1 DUF2975 domain-containing protein [Bacillus sp. ISL-101]
MNVKQGSTTFLKVIIFLAVIAVLALCILLTYIEKNNAFSELSLKSLKIIKKCAFTVIFLILLGIVSLRVLAKVTGSDDAAGPTSLCLMCILATSIIAAIVDALQKPLKNAPDLMSKK